jgi:purine-binding chemotaxis protein CheW
MGSLNMKVDNFLVFEVHHSLYCIASSRVVELIFLPELSHVESSPFYIVGHFNFRGSFIPVMDLFLRQGLNSKKYSAQDRILIIEFNGVQYGIHINEVHNVIDINLERMTVPRHEEENLASISNGIIQTEFGMTQIINIDVLLNFSNHKLNSPFSNDFLDSQLSKLIEGMTDLEKKILEKRKHSYSEVTAIEEYASMTSMVIFELGNEIFSIDLKNILEFSNGEGITKIPCISPHVAGCINLRGDILILIDLLYIIKDEKTVLDNSKKIIIIREGELMVGFVVDLLIDVIYLGKEQILGKPSEKRTSGRDFLKGTCLYESKVVGILDIEKLFEYDRLFVEDYVA